MSAHDVKIRVQLKASRCKAQLSIEILITAIVGSGVLHCSIKLQSYRYYCICIYLLSSNVPAVSDKMHNFLIRFVLLLYLYSLFSK